MSHAREIAVQRAVVLGIFGDDLHHALTRAVLQELHELHKCAHHLFI
eukprot:CAMPEP_0116987392 /NCGR_PEP_ID=MMETSP0467-20121206/63481_1 /TAXON_ID=283647 /ORGANISM="Mesodinium pulex, Strain SPMC105" /LENGTH=46 /DNA_ID= /DNA_START= /DNA_END= /DNA_ORIENTATION=